MVQIKEGDKVANFILPMDGSGIINTLKDINNLYIVYFYPKDDTPGCTIEAINFSESSSFFEDNNITIIGISKDSVEKHDKFKNKHNLKIILAADTDGKVCESFGVWVQKSMYGRKYMGIERSTFMIFIISWAKSSIEISVFIPMLVTFPKNSSDLNISKKAVQISLTKVRSRVGSTFPNFNSLLSE